MRQRGRWVRLVALAAGIVLAATACGTQPSGGGRSLNTLTDKPTTLRFLWFDWPPAKALEAFANTGYRKLRPNVTVDVQTVPVAAWHDSIFSQFEAKKTNFDIAVLDSQDIGGAVSGGHVLDITNFARSNIDLQAYDSYLLAAYGQYPQTITGKLDENARLYGLPLLGDTWVMIYRKDLIGPTPPATFDDMLEVAEACQQRNRSKGVWGLAFHQANTYDAAAVTYNAINGIYGGQIWDPTTKRVDGVINDAAGRKAMGVLVNRMRPMTPPNASNDYIEQVNTRIAQGRACIGFNWLATTYGLLDPKTSKLGTTKAEILEKLGFASVPGQVANPVPLGGMGMHVSAHTTPQQQAEALNFIKWFEQADTQRSWAVVGGIPARSDALRSPEFLTAAPWNKVYADSVPRLRDFWNVPQYAKLLGVQTANVNAALVGEKPPLQALDDIARQQQAIFDGLG
jgi:multiple sugar transport system substrate-binding protein